MDILVWWCGGLCGTHIAKRDCGHYIGTLIWPSILLPLLMTSSPAQVLHSFSVNLRLSYQYDKGAHNPYQRQGEQEWWVGGGFPCYKNPPQPFLPQQRTVRFYQSPHPLLIFCPTEAAIALWLRQTHGVPPSQAVTCRTYSSTMACSILCCHNIDAGLTLNDCTMILF